jgi:hypothetical protein
LLLLRDLGLPRQHEDAQRGAALVVDGLLGPHCDDAFHRNLAECDRCIVGMILSLAIYFGIDDARVDAMVENVLGEMMPDGAWNCRKGKRPKPNHSSFHTTLNVLDGVREAIEWRPSRYQHDLLRAEASAIELLLQHKLFRSDKSGAIIHPKFILLTYPHYWHYDALRGICYLARAQATPDPRIQDALDLLHAKCLPNGAWPVEYRYSGVTFFHMEVLGRPSRWNTLRALRVLKWCGEKK